MNNPLPSSAPGTARTGSPVAKPCNLCGSKDYRLLFTKFGFDIVQCESCGLEYLPWILTPQDLHEFYNDGYFTGQADKAGYLDYSSDEPILVQNFDLKLRDLEKLRAPGRLLDVGAALGFCVQAAQARGWQAQGVDVSEYAVAAAQQRGLDVRCADTLDSFADEQFDMVTLWDVIEHFNDPRGALQQAWRVLKPGGLVVVSTGNIGHPLSRMLGRHCRMYSPPQHLFYFSRLTMQATLEATGFKMVYSGCDTKSVKVHYVLHIIRTLVDNRLVETVGRWLQRLIPDRTVRLTLWDVMVLAARKPPKLKEA